MEWAGAYNIEDGRRRGAIGNGNKPVLFLRSGDGCSCVSPSGWRKRPLPNAEPSEQSGFNFQSKPSTSRAKGVGLGPGRNGNPSSALIWNINNIGHLRILIVRRYLPRIIWQRGRGTMPFSFNWYWCVEFAFYHARHLSIIISIADFSSSALIEIHGIRHLNCDRQKYNKLKTMAFIFVSLLARFSGALSSHRLERFLWPLQQSMAIRRLALTTSNCFIYFVFLCYWIC